jgi:hypothetical protein
MQPADGQRTWIVANQGTIVLPADSTEHGWAQDITITAPDSVQVELDREAMRWNLIE